jgi:opacity protein-like surface antigen
MRVARMFAWRVIVAVGLVVSASTAARAQGFISPFAGYNFGGDSGCLRVSNCEDRKLNLGVALGTAGIIGFEEEFAYAKNFFGEIPGAKTSVLTLMSNVMVAPTIGPVRPYAVIGVGLIKSRLDLTLNDVTSAGNNNFGWDIGGGLMLMFGHFGVRGDLRYFHSFEDLEFAGVSLSDLKLDFGRAAAGIVLQF